MSASVLSDKQFLYLGAGALVLVGVGAYMVRRVAGKVAEVVPEALATVGEAVNPVSHENIFNRGVNSVVESVTGKQGNTLGTWIYDLVHGEPDL